MSVALIFVKVMWPLPAFDLRPLGGMDVISKKGGL